MLFGAREAGCFRDTVTILGNTLAYTHMLRRDIGLELDKLHRVALNRGEWRKLCIGLLDIDRNIGIKPPTKQCMYL